jgi:hypothetical protein
MPWWLLNPVVFRIFCGEPLDYIRRIADAAWLSI